jgi:muramoyltetrapeptide carboxypeptidase
MGRRPTIHLLSVAGSDRELPGQLGLNSSAELVEWIQDVVGEPYRVTADLALMDAVVRPERGGRWDDAARARDLQRALGDDRVAAMISLRGGSWLTRILGRVDFDVLDRRRNPLHIFGFSELTTLVNITAQWPMVHAHYDLGPGFLLWGLRGYARSHHAELTRGLPGSTDEAMASSFASGWAAARFRDEFAGFFEDAIRIITGDASNRPLTGAWIGKAPGRVGPITAFGGCISVLVGLLGTPLQSCLDAHGRWLALEDVREEPHRIDRYLAQLQLSDTLKNCRGLLLGDFHHGAEDQTDTVVQLIRRHLRGTTKPILARCNFGHCYPVAGLPLNRPMRLGRPHRGRVQLIPA